jgi:hypothetical protein
MLFCGSIFLLCHDRVEFLEGESLVAFGVVEDVDVVHHFLDFVVVHGLPEFLSDCPDFIKIDEAALVRVVQVIQFLQPVLGLSVAQPLADDVHEVVKVELAV